MRTNTTFVGSGRKGDIDTFSSHVGVPYGANSPLQLPWRQVVARPAEAGRCKTERLMKAAWEAMLIEGMNGATEPEAASSSSTTKTSDFQTKIKQTMDKLKESETNLQV